MDFINSKAFVISSYIGFVILILCIFGGLVYYTQKEFTATIPDQKSLTKMQQLKNVMQSLLGDNWNFIIILFCIFILIIIIFLYTISKSGINITIEGDGKPIYISTIIFLVIFSISMIVITILEILNNTSVANSTLTNNFKNVSSVDTYNSNVQILQIIGLSIFLLIFIIFIFWYFLHKRKQSTTPPAPEGTPAPAPEGTQSTSTPLVIPIVKNKKKKKNKSSEKRKKKK